MIPELAPLEGKYQILRKLRDGGMGAIFLVRHRLLGDLRVVKVLRAQLQGEEEFRDRFAREARVAIQLRHANVAQLYDFAVDDRGSGYMVLEYVKGSEKFLELVNQNVGMELQKIGLEVINVNIRDITDESGYIEAIGKKAAAEAVNQARIEVPYLENE